MRRMSRFGFVLTTTALVFASLGLGACGGSDEAKGPVAQPTPTPAESVPASTSDGVDAAPATTAATCEEIRTTDPDYDSVYDDLDCSEERPRLCVGVPRADARYVAYRCATLDTTTAKQRAARKRAAKKRAAAKRRREAAARAASRKVESTESKTQTGGFGSTAKERSSSGSSSAGSSSSGSSGSSSSGSTTKRKR